MNKQCFPSTDGVVPLPESGLHATIKCVAYAATGGFAMAYQRFPHAMDSAARKWRDLAERRRAHFVELFETGRWRHYYTDTQFLVEMRNAMAMAQRWAKIAPTPEERARAN